MKVLHESFRKYLETLVGQAVQLAIGGTSIIPTTKDIKRAVKDVTTASFKGLTSKPELFSPLNLIKENKEYYRYNIKPGMEVLIVLKQDQRTGKLTKGRVQKILTSKNKHTRGIKVRLTSGQVGRVQKILS